MARENSFVFFGAIMNDPIVLFNDESKSYRITFSLETTRRNGRKDYPKINIYDLSEEQAKKYAATLKCGVFIQIHGMVYTRVVKKPVRCECCNNINQIDTMQTEIVTFGKPFICEKQPELSDISEFANNGMLLGSSCTEVYRRDSTAGSIAAQFQMAIQRRGHIKSVDKDIRTDYPWIKVFGKTAEECLKRVRTSSQVFITGAFQTRDIERHVKCQFCKNELTYEERVGEIVPNGIEFLNNCNFDKKTKDTPEETENEESR